jgi:hypothetical protein
MVFQELSDNLRNLLHHDRHRRPIRKRRNRLRVEALEFHIRGSILCDPGAAKAPAIRHRLTPDVRETIMSAVNGHVRICGGPRV